MKYYNKTFISIGILILFSCNEETINKTEDTSVLDGNGLTVINYRSSNNGKNSKSYNNKSSFIGTSIAVFNDETTYENYITSLEAQAENWDDAFLEEWGHLNDDELNAKEEELNFDSEKPLTDFENQIGLPSLRKQYLLAEEIWLNNDVLNPLTDPDNNPLYDFDVSEMTVMNTLAEVQIGTTIIKKLNADEISLINNELSSKNATNKTQRVLLDDDATLIIANSDYDALIDFNNGDTSVINNSNVTVTNNTTTTSCKYAEEVRKDFSIDSKKFFKALIKVPSPSFGWNGKVKAKIVSYKKGVFGWRKWRTNIDVGATGNVYSSNCDNTPTYINKWKGAKKRKKRVFNWRNSSFGSHKVENGGMTGLFRHNNVVKELKLTW